MLGVLSCPNEWKIRRVSEGSDANGSAQRGRPRGGERELTAALEVAGHLRPRVALGDQTAAGGAERGPPRGVAQQRDHSRRERGRVVLLQEVAPGLERQTLGPHGRGDQRPAHGERLEGLDASPAAYAQGYHVHLARLLVGA